MTELVTCTILERGGARLADVRLNRPDKLNSLTLDLLEQLQAVAESLAGDLTLGGGLQIALAADYRFTTPDATWSVLEAKWGLVPDMSGVQALSELVRIDVAKRLAMTGEIFDGTRAVALGVASELADDPYAAGLALLDELATRSPDAVAASKRLFDETWTADAARTFARERAEQSVLLSAANTAVTQHRSLGGDARPYGPRLH